MTRHCPRCDSPQPHLHPAMQFEGEVQPCSHPYHQTVTASNTLARIIADKSAEMQALGVTFTTRPKWWMRALARLRREEAAITIREGGNR